MRLPRSLQWRIALAYTVLILVSMGAVSVYLVNFVRNSYIANLEEHLEKETGLVNETAAEYFRGSPNVAGLQEESERIGELVGVRVTIIAVDGWVLSDTWEDPAVMENHSQRPEVRAALTEGLGRDTRVSATVGEEMLYTAVPIRVDGTVVGVARTAVPTSQIHASVRRIVTVISLSALVVAFLAVALAYYVARRSVRSVHSVAEGARRLSEGDLEYRVEALTSDETQELAHAFNRMAASLREVIQGLSSERNRLSAVLDTMADGIVVIGGEGRIDLMNRTAGEMLGVDVSRAIHGRFMQVIRDHDLHDLVSQSLSTGQQQHKETEILSSRRFLSAIATRLGEDGTPGVLLTLHDLTRFRQVETTRREFVSNVSHEMRSPLASIKVMVETLEDGALEEQPTARDFIQRIHREVDHMADMVNDLLELSRIESGRTVPVLVDLDMRPLVEEVKEQFQERARVKDIAMVASLPESLPHVRGDRERLRQVLVNLLDNALKFTPEQGRVTISASARARDVEFRVSDTGIGIPREHLPHIFERFYKVESSRRDAGTGLGLAIVKHIVQAHGGEVKVESREGIGSTFTFTVPRSS